MRVRSSSQETVVVKYSTANLSLSYRLFLFMTKFYCPPNPFKHHKKIQNHDECYDTTEIVVETQESNVEIPLSHASKL